MKYVQVCAAVGKQAAKYHTFCAIWLLCVPHIKFMTPRTDVCHYCEDFRVEIVKAVTEADKTKLAQGFKEHVEEAQKERKFYCDCIKKAEESGTIEDTPPLHI